MRAFLLFLVLFGIASAAIFGYKYVTKQDVKVAGKLTFAGLLAFIFSVVIYLGEVA
jgi:hypothetical protein